MMVILYLMEYYQIIKSRKYVQDVIPLFVGCCMQYGVNVVDIFHKTKMVHYLDRGQQQTSEKRDNLNKYRPHEQIRVT